MTKHKEQLRKQLRADRRAMGITDINTPSELIISRALQIVDWHKVGSIHIYQSIESLREVDTHGLILQIEQEHPHLRIATWRKTSDGYRSVWLGGDDHGQVIPPNYLFDVIVVPLLGFNGELQRLGFGGGLYDKFLATQPRAISIGFCIQSGFVESLEAEEHDIALSCIVTEQFVYGSTTK